MTDVTTDLATRALHLSVKQDEIGTFNVFDVMHYGTSERQLSAVFKWMLDASESHRLADSFLKIFIDEVNEGQRKHGGMPAPYGHYEVFEEVNTSPPGEPKDIADLVLEGDTTAIVIENYYKPDGHGHCYQAYLDYGRQENRDSIVVMLCQSTSQENLIGGWKNAAVVSYPALLTRLKDHVDATEGFREANPEQGVFVDHLYQRFVKGTPMKSENLIEFIDAMCVTGEAGRYAVQNKAATAEQLADDLRLQVVERFEKSTKLLRDVKVKLASFAQDHLMEQLNLAISPAAIGSVYKNYRGASESTVGLQHVDDPDGRFLQIKFGPSAWSANVHQTHWHDTVRPEEADYKHLFLTFDGRVRQSQVTLQEVLVGLDPNDVRLRDEFVELRNDAGTSTSQPDAIG